MLNTSPRGSRHFTVPTWDREDERGADPAACAVSTRSALGKLRQFAPGDTDPSTEPHCMDGHMRS